MIGEAPAFEGEFEWLPECADWQEALAEARTLELADALKRYRSLAKTRMDFARTVKLDRAIQKHRERADQVATSLPTVRLALLGSSTLSHLVPGIRVAGLRRGMLVEVYEAPYGMYRQELADPSSGLHSFAPTAVLLALDAHHLAGPEQSADGRVKRALETMQACWQMARRGFSCAVLQQTVLPVFPPLLGNNEHLLEDSPHAAVETINREIRARTGAEGVTVLALDEFARQAGIRRWHDEGLWHRAKQEVHPRMAPLYGDQVVRVLAAIGGQSSKCLVLDLDHTLWGGAIGDDGLEGIELGQGSAVGEAFAAFQRYAKGVMERGVILAVCSKNDEANALLPFERHPEMVLRRSDIACFVANWDDKATNLRRIARVLKIGLDALVFVDDNPAERGLVRRELPMVEVPEMPEDPGEYVRVLAGAGYFEGTSVTPEDRDRANRYAAYAASEVLRDSATDLESYLAGLRMELLWGPFDAQGRARIVQIINKTNQFNLTTKRCVDADIERAMARPEVLGLQFRLRDIYGDNGMIAVLQCEPDGGALAIDTWLMSCRVLGRQVEQAMMNVLVEQARSRRLERILGRYVPTAKNGMVRDHYRRMGFSLVETAEDGATLWELDTRAYQPFKTQITSK